MMAVEEVFTHPPPKSDDIPLRIYSNPICPFAQVLLIIHSIFIITIITIEGTVGSCF